MMFFFLITKAIPLKNRENQTSYHYCTFVAHLADESLSVCRQAGTPADRSAGKLDGRPVGARAGLQASVRMPICFCLLHHSFVASLLR